MGLTLTRRVGEVVNIGPNITVRIEEIRSLNEVRINITAPGDVPIGRGDIDTAGRRHGNPPCLHVPPLRE
jgi:carbon storage regulator CsrA